MNIRKTVGMIKKHGRKHVALGAGERCERDFVVMGHWLYVRECRPPDIKNDDGSILLYRPERSKSACTVCEIIGIGKDVGKARSKKISNIAKRYAPETKRMNVRYTVGQKILRPSDHPWGMIVSGFAPKDELFIDENVPLMVLEN